MVDLLDVQTPNFGMVSFVAAVAGTKLGAIPSLLSSESIADIQLVLHTKLESKHLISGELSLLIIFLHLHSIQCFIIGRSLPSFFEIGNNFDAEILIWCLQEFQELAEDCHYNLSA